jgi:hypothetical protein
MDPQATFDQLLAACAAGDWEEAKDHARNLLAWLKHGGFPPRILTHPHLGSGWDAALAQAACQYALALIHKPKRHSRPPRRKEKPHDR